MEVKEMIERSEIILEMARPNEDYIAFTSYREGKSIKDYQGINPSNSVWYYPSNDFIHPMTLMFKRVGEDEYKLVYRPALI